MGRSASYKPPWKGKVGIADEEIYAPDIYQLSDEIDTNYGL